MEESKKGEIALRIISQETDCLIAYVPSLNHYTAKQLVKILEHHPEKTELMHLLRAQCLKEQSLSSGYQPKAKLFQETENKPLPPQAE